MKTNHFTFVLATALAAFAAPSALRAQNLIQNGSFELGELTVVDYLLQTGDSAHANPTTNWVESWSFDQDGTSNPTSTSIVHKRNGGVTWQNASDGNQFIFFATTAYNPLWQTVDLVAGTTYLLSFDVMHNSQNATVAPRIDFSLTATGDDALDELVIIDFTRRAWHTYEFEFTAALDATYTFAISGAPNINNMAQGLFLDNVSLTAVAVPEPAAFAALAGLGVLSLAATRRRRA